MLRLVDLCSHSLRQCRRCIQLPDHFHTHGPTRHGHGYFAFCSRGRSWPHGRVLHPRADVVRPFLRPVRVVPPAVVRILRDRRLHGVPLVAERHLDALSLCLLLRRVSRNADLGNGRGTPLNLRNGSPW